MTSQFPPALLDAIQHARDIAAARARADAALEAAIQAHYDADNAYRAADTNTDEEESAWDVFNDTIHALASAARVRTDARIEEETARRHLEQAMRDWTHATNAPAPIR